MRDVIQFRKSYLVAFDNYVLATKHNICMYLEYDKQFVCGDHLLLFQFNIPIRFRHNRYDAIYVFENCMTNLGDKLVNKLGNTEF